MPGTPSFWWHQNLSWKAYLLIPLGRLYVLLTWIARGFKKRQTMKAPSSVVSVGNLVMGGAGKTPVTLALAVLLKEKGFHPVGVSRGYGGDVKAPSFVAPTDDWRRVGDEALLLAQEMPTFVSRQRSKALSLIPFKKKTVILLDDGHQHESLYKDLSLIVMNDIQQHGNGQVFPAGPLREPLTEGLSRAHALIWIGSGPSPSLSIPTLRASLLPAVSLKKGERVVAFAGLGYPDKFRRTLEDLGLEVVDFRGFPDHFPYRCKDLMALEKISREKNAPLVTTEKDFMRLPPAFQPKIFCVKIKMVWEDPQAVWDVIGQYL
jgi:tetraacyldisaccharide 4'-kinase